MPNASIDQPSGSGTSDVMKFGPKNPSAAKESFCVGKVSDEEPKSLWTAVPSVSPETGVESDVPDKKSSSEEELA